MVEGGGKERRRAYNSRRVYDDELKAELIKQRQRAVVCAVAILLEEKGVLIGVIQFGRYGKLTCSALARSLDLNGSLAEVTRQVEGSIPCSFDITRGSSPVVTHRTADV